MEDYNYTSDNITFGFKNNFGVGDVKGLVNYEEHGLNIWNNLTMTTEAITSRDNISHATPYIPAIGSSGATTAHKIITLILYLSTFVVGFLGNALVIIVISKFKDVRTKSVANYYILNLAIADEIFILTLPLFCHATFTENWIFGNPMCKISYILREINKFGSIFTLAALSVDRFLASYHELSFLRTIRAGKIVCLSVWVASVAMCLPFFLYSYSIPTGEKAVCRINWPQRNTLYHKKLWTYSQITIGLILPLIVITLSYIFLMQRLKGIMALRQTHRTKRPNKKLTRTIVIVVITFVACQVPYYVMDIISLHKSEIALHHYERHGEHYTPSHKELIAFIYCHAIAQMLVFISSSCNPIIYGITNDNFRQLYRQVLFCQKPEAQHIPLQNNSNQEYTMSTMPSKL